MTQNKELRNRPIHLQLIFDQGAKQIQWGKELFLTNGAKTTGYPYEKKMNLNLYFVPYTKINLSWITDP